MNNTFDEYVKEPNTLSLEQMQQIHAKMMDAISTDPDARELYEAVLNKAIIYANMRAQWELMDREEKMEKDSLRTSRHDTVITNLNMLSRFLKMQGKDISWRDELGYTEDDPSLRKTIGDFACYLAFVNAICNR